MRFSDRLARVAAVWLALVAMPVAAAESNGPAQIG